MSWLEVEGTGGSSDESKIDYLKFEAGKGKETVMRVMDEAPVSKWRHWLASANRSVSCCGKGCPVCASMKLAKAAGVKSPYGSTMKHTLHVINKKTGKLELLEQGKTFFDQLLAYKTNIGDLRDYDIKVIRTGEKKDTTYTMIPMQASGLTKEELALYEANKFDIADLIKAYTPEQTKGFMEGKSAEEIFKSDDAIEEDIKLEDSDITPLTDGEIPF